MALSQGGFGTKKQRSDALVNSRRSAFNLSFLKSSTSEPFLASVLPRSYRCRTYIIAGYGIQILKHFNLRLYIGFIAIHNGLRIEQNLSRSALSGV